MLKKKIAVILSVVTILFIGGIGVFYYYSTVPEPVIAEVLENIETTTVSTNYIYVDIKGAVKKAGVYKVEANSIVNDVISLAGGLKDNAYTKNINLSQRVKDEMVIYIFTKNEVKSTTSKEIITNATCTTNVIEVNNCVSTTTKKEESTTTVNVTQNNLININTASIEALMTLTGVGEAKAKSIIAYRETTPFNTIEDIMNVSGIGTSAFEKIKDNITV